MIESLRNNRIVDMNMKYKGEKFPAFGNTCTNCLKKEPFFVVKNKNKVVEKIERKKKDIILKVKINNFDVDIQMDTNSEVTLIRKIYGKALESQLYESAV